MSNSFPELLKPRLWRFSVLHLFAIVMAISVLARPACGQSAETTASASEGVVVSAPTVPKLIKFTGTLLDQRGYPITVPVDATFALYPQQGAEESSAVWHEQQGVSPNEKGVYSVYLGAIQSLPAQVFTSVTAQYLGVKVEGELEQARTVLVSVPYALESGDAQTLGGLPASAYALAGSKVGNGSQQIAAAPNAVQPAASGVSTVTTTGGVSNVIPEFSGTSTIVDSPIFVASNGYVGVNQASPTATLDVGGSENVRGILALPALATATASTGQRSQLMQFSASAWSSATKAAVSPTFKLLANFGGNNTASPSGDLEVHYQQGPYSANILSIASNGVINFAPAQTFPYKGTVTSVSLTAPGADFTVTGSPVTGAGGFNLIWNTPPTSADVGSAIIKRDSNGGFVAGAINADSLVAGGSIGANSLTVYGPSYMGAANLAGPIGIGTNSPAALLNLNQNNTASTDYLLLGNTSSKGLQLRDNGTGVDIESIGVPLNINYLTQQQTVINPNGGTVIINDNRVSTGNYAALRVGTIVDSYGTPVSGQFEGDVYIDGALQVYGSKNFRIDHPLDPENKYLVHAAIESSEVLNQYSGNVTTDEFGLAHVQLPEWFDVENSDFRYQLTVIGGRFAQAIVSKEIEKNQFTISTNATNVRVSWQVTARRNDPYMKAHPFVVEQEKPAHERGTYLRPELYGQPEEKRTGGSHRDLPATPQNIPIAALKP